MSRTILMIDNYDSFTFNLVQLLAAAGARVDVVRNDAESVGELLAREPAGIVVSPGPGRPEDAGVSVGLFESGTRVPILGVCLGHQSLGAAYGARVVRSERVMHGKTSPVSHEGDELFAGLPSPFEATRYHSLIVPAEGLPEPLVPIAHGDDGTLQGMRHGELPYWGVQFHPESVLTRVGPRMMHNFLRLCGIEPEGAAAEPALGGAVPEAATPVAEPALSAAGAGVGGER